MGEINRKWHYHESQINLIVSIKKKSPSNEDDLVKVREISLFPSKESNYLNHQSKRGQYILLFLFYKPPHSFAIFNHHWFHLFVKANTPLLHFFAKTKTSLFHSFGKFNHLVHKNSGAGDLTEPRWRQLPAPGK